MFTRSASTVLVLLVVCSITVLAQLPPPASFQPPVNYTTGTLPTSVAVGDFNGDGKPDLAVANECSDPNCDNDYGT